MNAKTQFMIYAIRSGERKEAERFGIDRLLAQELSYKDSTGRTFTSHEDNPCDTEHLRSLIRECKADAEDVEFEHTVNKYEFPSDKCRDLAWNMLVEMGVPNLLYVYRVNQTVVPADSKTLDKANSKSLDKADLKPVKKRKR